MYASYIYTAHHIFYYHQPFKSPLCLNKSDSAINVRRPLTVSLFIQAPAFVYIISVSWFFITFEFIFSWQKVERERFFFFGVTKRLCLSLSTVENLTTFIKWTFFHFTFVSAREKRGEGEKGGEKKFGTPFKCHLYSTYSSIFFHSHSLHVLSNLIFVSIICHYNYNLCFSIKRFTLNIHWN